MNIQCYNTPLLFVGRRITPVAPPDLPEFPRMAGSELWNAGNETVMAGEDFPAGQNAADDEGNFLTDDEGNKLELE